MAAGDLVRELVIRLGLQGSAEAKAELEEVAASVDKLGATQTGVAETATAASKAEVAGATAVTAAVEEQAAATAHLETVLETKARIAEQAANVELDAEARLAEARLAARFAVEKLGEATAAGGKVMTAALLEARNAVGSLEVAIAAARAAGGPISQASLAELASYDQRIKALSATLVTGASQQKIFGAEAAIMRDNVSGAARAVASLGGDLASTLLPIGVFLVALDLIPRLLEGADSKTKSWAASLVNLVNGLHDEDAAVRKSSESQEVYEARLQNVLRLKEDYVRASIAMGAGVIAETKDVGAAIVEWQGHEAALHGNIQQYAEFAAALKAMGVTFRATHDEMISRAIAFGNAYAAVLKRDGIEQANAFAASNKAVLDKIISDFERAGTVVPAQLKEIARAIGLVSTAESDAAKENKLLKHLDDQSVAFDGLVAAVKRGAAELGSYTTAVATQHPEIDRQIEQLHILQATEKGLTDIERDRLNALIVMHAELSALTPEQEKLNKANDDAKKAIIALGQEELKLIAAYEKSLATIREHAAAQTAATERELRAMQASADGQIAALDKLRREGTISQEEFASKVAELQNAEVEARRAAETKEEVINKEKVQSEKETTDKFTEATAKIKVQLEERKSDLEKAEQAAKDFATANEASTKAIAAEAAAIAAGVTTRHGYETEIKEIGKASAAMAGVLEGVATKSVPKLHTSLDGLISKLKSVREQLDDVGSAASRAFSAGGSGGAPDAGVGATPGSEGG